MGFASGESREMKSRMLTKASLEETQAYHHGLNQLMPDTMSYNSQIHNVEDLMADNDQNNQPPFSQTTLKNIERHNLDKVDLNLNHDPIDPGCDSDSSSTTLLLLRNLPSSQAPSLSQPSSSSTIIDFTQPSSSPTIIDLNSQEPTINNHQPTTNYYPLSSSTTTLGRSRQSLPGSNQKQSYLRQNRITKNKRVKLSSKPSSKPKSKTDSKDRDKKTDEMYKEEFDTAQENIRGMRGYTYSVNGSNGSRMDGSNGSRMDWEVVPEYTNLQPIPTRRNTFLGIQDYLLKEKISNSAISMVDLYLELQFVDGEWLRQLDVFNQKIIDHNDSLSGGKGSSVKSGGLSFLSGK